jgi:DHA3 family multidrug efflux protein-like MFS transporter
MTEPSTAASQASAPPAGGTRTFVQVLINTMIANVTTSYLWFALTFWVYLENT